METNVEGNIHKLRLRLIDSDAKQQRSRSHEPKKQTPRKSNENHHRTYSKPAHDYEFQRVHDLYSHRYRANQRTFFPNYSYDSRLYLQPLQEEQLFSSSNMDDLIDSMARRRLAFRQFNTNVDQQRSSNGYYSSYIEPINPEQIYLRNEDVIYTNRSSRSQSERDSRRAQAYEQMLRLRTDQLGPDSDEMNMTGSSGQKTPVKLPPISSGQKPNQARISSNKNESQPTLPLISSEHVIKLPSDIYVSSKSDHSTHKTRRHRSISKETQSESDQSEGETDTSTDNRPKKKNSQNSDTGFFTESDLQQKKKTKVPRNQFKKKAIAILFTIILKRRLHQTRPHRSIQSPNQAIQKIRLQELLVALHRVYLEPDGPIFNALIQAITHPISLQHALNSSSKYYTDAIETIGNAMKDIISKIIQFMPKDGILGTTKTSAISIYLQNGNPFPDNYFWQCEREHLEFDHLKLINITKQRAILLLIDLFIFRALVTTLLIKPIKYRLILGQLTSSQSTSLKVLSSVMLYLGRRTAGSKSEILAVPQEWKFSLYTDEEIQAIIQHSEIKSIINTCEQSLRMWCKEYIRRIDESFGKELRR
ncbi:hypothetical protein I4U23_014352 [Adineta vaga]|nr:hypothetical protein I4U23_014352 [Adineta vaga]